MKKITLFLITFSLSIYSFAQTTNTFPATGSVGIGTTTPVSGSLLDIETTTNGLSTIVLHNASTGISARTRFALQNDNGTASFNLNGSQYSVDPGLLSIFSPSSVTFGISGVEAMRIGLGSIGIGTKTQSETLTITNANNNTNISSLGLYRSIAGGTIGTGNTAGQINLGIYNSTNAATIYGAQIAAVSTEAWNPGTAQGTAIVFRTTPNTTVTASESMRIDHSGNVAIGTTNPNGYKLAVNGSVIATTMTVKLYANWPDYVFNKNYSLPSLNDVKKYIDQNKHLPEIPSQQDIAKNGIDLGEINKLLVKKVEELTLYMIELEKKMKAQQLEIDKLKAKVSR